MDVRIVLSTAALELLATFAENEFKSEAVPAGAGLWSVPISEETHDRLTSEQLQGESLSDTTMRLCSIARHGRN